MNSKIKLFGIAREIIGSSELEWEIAEASTVQQLLDSLKSNYPQLANLKSLAVAVNSVYAKEGDKVSSSDEIALIPPVSGG
ncbi:MoaD/ThiS family protein [Rapidithrix thailandica]|uniref:Molybdopterin synthase sulfur carrier subunit n=1 Tax=Rapidithrix thailandica TaxID=413964 RepID=A0AAW9SKP9_9BACT